MTSNTTEIAVTVIKGLGSGFSLTVCLGVLVYLVYYKVYYKLLHRLFILLLVSSSLFSFSILFESVAVNIVILATHDRLKENIETVLCTLSGSLFHYSTWVDILVITIIAIWLWRITSRTKRFSSSLDKQEYKKRIRQKYWEALGYTIIFLLPVIPIVPLLATKEYEVNEGTWCRLAIEPNETGETNGQGGQSDINPKSLITGLVVWYIPVVVIMVLVTIILAIVNVKLIRKLRASSKILRGSHSDVLKDGIYLSIFLMIIYTMYIVNIFTALYYTLKMENVVPLWITEAVVTSIRGVVILCMFCSRRMWKKFSNNRISIRRNTRQMLNHIFDNSYNVQGTESLMATPSLISATEEPFNVEIS